MINLNGLIIFVVLKTDISQSLVGVYGSYAEAEDVAAELNSKGIKTNIKVTWIVDRC
jgi:hypothetical protein